MHFKTVPIKFIFEIFTEKISFKVFCQTNYFGVKMRFSCFSFFFLDTMQRCFLAALGKISESENKNILKNVDQDRKPLKILRAPEEIKFAGKYINMLLQFR